MTEQVSLHFEFFPKAWDKGVSEQFFDRLVGPDRLMPATRIGNEGKQDLPKDVDETRAELVWRYEAMSKGNHIQLFAQKGSADFWVNLVRVEWDEDTAFGSLLFWPKKMVIYVPLEHWRARDWMPDVIEVAKMTGTPLVSLDYRSRGEHGNFYFETRNAMKRIVQSTIHAKASMGPWRGLGRIGWTRIFGPDIVRMIGSDRLESLTKGTATDHGDGYWTVSSAPDPADWQNAEVRASEYEIVQELGHEFFADIESNRLALRVPDFPTHLVPRDDVLFERYGQTLKPS